MEVGSPVPMRYQLRRNINGLPLPAGRTLHTYWINDMYTNLRTSYYSARDIGNLFKKDFNRPTDAINSVFVAEADTIEELKLKVCYLFL